MPMESPSWDDVRTFKRLLLAGDADALMIWKSNQRALVSVWEVLAELERVEASKAHPQQGKLSVMG